MIFFVRICLVTALLAPLAVPAQAQQAVSATTIQSEANRQLEVGIAYERQRQWIQAIQHYEESLRSFSDNADLSRRLLIARLHYDVVRRSSDAAIVSLIDTVATEDALDLYSEVLARLETSYVEPIRIQELVRSGTAYLEVALTEPGFVDRFLTDRSPEVIEEFRTSIHKLTLSRRLLNRQDARQTVAAAAEAAERSLGLNPTATVMQFVFGAVGLLDPYSSFLSSAELNEVESQIEGNFVGLGVALKPHEVPLKVLNVITGGPAREAGMQAGDSILEIDSTVCRDIGAERAADLLRGPENSTVRLLVRRSTGEQYERTITRRRVEVPSVEGVDIIDPAAGVGYLKISSFQKTTAAELDQALWKLHRDGMQSLIIDLRGNPGGWLDASVAAADRFVSAGGIVSTRGKNGIENQNYKANAGGTWQVPLVVLIDNESASASEIFAGAIRDNHRGQLVGVTTYGKGSVQGLFHTRALSSGIRLTVSKFYSPDGTAISQRGVQPTVVVESQASDATQFVSKPAIDNPQPRSKAVTDRALRVAIESARKERFASQARRN